MKDDLIRRSDLKEELHSWAICINRPQFYSVEDADCVIDTMPAVDAVEVVRCKDCKHYKTQNKSARWNHETLYCMRSAAVKMKPDDFCSCGERRKE